MRRWFFEVWNEPNLQAFWTGTQAEYFELYARTARAIKEVDPKLRVGGPATAMNAWIAEFLAYCRQHDVPADFVSTHNWLALRLCVRRTPAPAARWDGAKPSYRAFQLLHQLGTSTVAVIGSHPTVDAWVVRGETGCTVVLTNFALPCHPIADETVTIRLDHLPQPASVTIQRIDAREVLRA